MQIIDSQYSYIEGSRCYCSLESESFLRQEISTKPLYALHRIGPGEYHYLTLFYLERIKEPFTLILFDNHPDDQPSAFDEGLLSCGGWILRARGLSECKTVLWVQSPEDFGKLRSLDTESKIYISLDLDVLSPEYSRTTWTQGSMDLSELLRELKYLKDRHIILGIDLCGGKPSGKSSSEDDTINSATFASIESFFRSW